MYLYNMWRWCGHCPTLPWSLVHSDLHEIQSTLDTCTVHEHKLCPWKTNRFRNHTTLTEELVNENKFYAEYTYLLNKTLDLTVDMAWVITPVKRRHWNNTSHSYIHTYIDDYSTKIFRKYWYISITMLPYLCKYVGRSILHNGIFFLSRNQ